MLLELENTTKKAIFTSYKDDGLALSEESPQEVERIKKKICQIFWALGLEIPVEANKKKVQFLYVERDLNEESYEPI